MTSAPEILANRCCVLLDFDGPVCAVFGGPGARIIGAQLSAFLTRIGVRVPDALFGTSDPFALLRLAATVSDNAAEKADAEFRSLETAAVLTAPQTEGAVDVLRALTETGRSVAIVSNNSEQAIRVYLDRHKIGRFVAAIAGRTSPNVALLKPSPHLLHEAMNALAATPDDSVMVGDSASDIDAARAAGVAVIAFANKPTKRQDLALLQPDAIVSRMHDLLPN